MSFAVACRLPDRTAVRLTGPDRYSFLQGLVSNDVAKVSTKEAVYAALLTPQGKFLNDMFLIADGETLFMDCDAATANDLVARLEAFRLRSKVTFERLDPTHSVWSLRGGFIDQPLCYQDPRLDELGYRAIVEGTSCPNGSSEGTRQEYEILRLKLGVPDPAQDLIRTSSTLIEGNFDFLNGIDWKKGCYIGQELTARMHYRGLAKRRLFPVLIEDLGAEDVITDADHAGELRSRCQNFGVASLKIDAVCEAVGAKTGLKMGAIQVYPAIPRWMKIDAVPANR